MLETAARCYAQIGEHDEALALLETCAERRCSSTRHPERGTGFRRAASDARFQALLRKIGLQ